MQLYIKSDLSFEDLANKIKSLGLPTYEMELRDGLNLGGGEYYKFSQGVSELLFVQNQNEVFVDSMEDFPYYFYVFNGSPAPLQPLKETLLALGIQSVLADQA